MANFLDKILQLFAGASFEEVFGETFGDVVPVTKEDRQLGSRVIDFINQDRVFYGLTMLQNCPKIEEIVYYMAQFFQKDKWLDELYQQIEKLLDFKIYAGIV